MGKACRQNYRHLKTGAVLRMSLTAPEGTSYDFMENYVDNVTQFVMDSVPEKEIVLSVTAPGFAGAGSVNSGFMRLRLKDSDKRKRSQSQIAQYLNKNLSSFNLGKAYTIEEQTISVGSAKFGLPVQFVLQNFDFQKIRTALPKFMDEVQKSPVFAGL